MKTFWPSYKGDDNWFWYVRQWRTLGFEFILLKLCANRSHEWVKHGTCVSTLSPQCYGSEYTAYQDVIDYFEVSVLQSHLFWSQLQRLNLFVQLNQQVLFLREEYDVYGALNVAGIFPGGYYSSKAMLEALRQGFGNRVKIDCDRNGQLSEVWLYFNVGGRDNYQLVDAEISGTCRGRVYYPKK